MDAIIAFFKIYYLSVLMAIGSLIVILSSFIQSKREIKSKHGKKTYIPYYILIGSLIAVVVSFCSDYDKSQYESGNIALLKGSDHCYFLPSIQEISDPEYTLSILNRDTIPCYDVYVIITADMDKILNAKPGQVLNDKAVHSLQHPMYFELGTVPAERWKPTNIHLAPGFYQIDIRTRSGAISQQFKFGIKGKDFGLSTTVSDFHGHLLNQYTSPNYPPIYAVQ